jgi:Undecaprenyl-phosphate galactose phosphotransferase WbaP
METVLLTSAHSFRSNRALARSRSTEHLARLAGNAAALAVAEAVALTVAILLAGGVRQLLLGEATMVVGPAWMVIPIYILVSSYARVLPGWGLGAVEELRRTVLVLAGVFALTMMGLWLVQTNVEGGAVSSRLTLALAGLFATVLVPYARSQAKAVLIRRHLWGVQAVVYGAGVAGAKIVRQLQEESGMGYNPVAVLDDNPDLWGGYLDLVPIIGDTAHVVPDASVAFLCLPSAERERQIELLDGPLSCYRTLVVIPDLFDAPSLWVKPRDIAGVLGLEVSSTLTRVLPRALKRTGDLLVVLALAPFWMPLVALLALAIWLSDRGSPFYAQERVGENGRLFAAHKLRTMVPDAEGVLARALEADPALREEWDTYFKLEKDPRITRVGAFLRRTSLDELPQLFNVLTGEMSLVGPRPLPRYHHDELPERVRTLRDRVRPGITGLWQVSGRSDAGNIGMERWDPYYVRNWSPWLDIVILVRTFRVVLKGSGAY